MGSFEGWTGQSRDGVDHDARQIAEALIKQLRATEWDAQETPEATIRNLRHLRQMLNTTCNDIPLGVDRS